MGCICKKAEGPESTAEFDRNEDAHVHHNENPMEAERLDSVEDIKDNKENKNNVSY